MIEEIDRLFAQVKTNNNYLNDVTNNKTRPISILSLKLCKNTKLNQTDRNRACEINDKMAIIENKIENFYRLGYYKQLNDLIFTLNINNVKTQKDLDYVRASLKECNSVLSKNRRT